MKILDLFCGAGGFTLGFAGRGNSVIGIDGWDVAVDTYRANLGRVFDNVEGMVSLVEDLDLATVGRVDILIGSPPCQSHSLNAKRAGKDARPDCRIQDRATIEAYYHVRDTLRPRYWIMENVLGCMEPGARVIYASDHGLYHARPRKFWGSFPQVHAGTVRRPRIPTVLAEEVKVGKKSYAKSWRSVSRTFGRIPHPWELQILMGFPSWYRFNGTKREQIRQIGNAVCPPVSRAIYRAIQTGKRLTDYITASKFTSTGRN